MTVKFYTVDSQYLCEVAEEDARLVDYEDYLSLRISAMKALEALQWAWGGEPLPTLELEAMEELKKLLK